MCIKQMGYFYDVSKLMILVCNYKEAHKEGNYFFPLIETGGYEGMHRVSV